MGRGPAESFRACFRCCTVGLGTLGLSPFSSNQLTSFSGHRPRCGLSTRTIGLPSVAPPSWAPSIAGSTPISPSAPCTVSSSASRQGDREAEQGDWRLGAVHSESHVCGAALTCHCREGPSPCRVVLKGSVLLPLIGPALFKEPETAFHPSCFLCSSQILSPSHPITFWPQTS